MRRDRLRIPSRYIEFLTDETGLPLINPTKKSLETVAKVVTALSERFVKGGKSNERYMDSHSLENAYFLYFGTSYLPKVFFPLGELLVRSDFFSRKRIRLIDLGSGTGAALFGTCLWLQENFKGSIEAVAVDYSRNALDNLKRRFALLFPAVSFRAVQADLQTANFLGEEPPFDLVTAAHVLNEIPDRQSFQRWVVEKTAPDGAVLLIEPALRETSRQLLHLRDKLTETGWSVISPCFRNADCPALEKESDWCHHDIPWERPEFIRWIDEKIGLIKKSLKYSYLLMTPQRQPAEDHAFRVVSDRFDEKGRTRIFLCGRSGRKMFVLNKRDRNDHNRVFVELERYDAVDCRNFTERRADCDVGKEGTIRLHGGGRSLGESIDGADELVDTE